MQVGIQKLVFYLAKFLVNSGGICRIALSSSSEILKSVKIRLFFGRFLFPLVAFPLLSIAVLPSSSGEDSDLFVRSQSEIERLWSGVLGCAESDDTFIIRNRFNDSSGFEDAGGGAVPAGTSRDYSKCGKRTLRNTSSRILVDTIEDAVRSGGVALLDEEFWLESNIGWVWGENITGDVEAVVPVSWIGDERSDGVEHALFVQPGLVLWPGLGDENRIDANLGVVYRTRLRDDVIVGGSLFYDYDLKQGNRRFGFGADLQSGILRAALNYYVPLSGWREGRANYEEQAIRGGDFRLGFALPDIRLGGSVGFWRFEGEDEVKTKWSPSLGMDAGVRIHPGVFLEAGYERHNKDNSIGPSWRTGVAFRFSLPGLEGASAFQNSITAPDLLEPVEREKRILYEERFGIIPAVTRFETSTATLAEGDDPFTMRFDFDKPLEREVTVVFEATARSSADVGDYTLSGTAMVIPPTISEASQGGPGQVVVVGEAQTNGESGRLEIVLPQYTSSMTLTVTITDDDISETDEIIELAANTIGANSRYARFDGLVRITIPRNDDYIIGFAETSSRVDEGAGAVTTHLLLRIGRLAPAGGVPISVSASGQTSDITFTSPTTVTVPAGTGEGVVAQSVASVAVTVNADTIGEGAEEVVFTIARGNSFPQLPWRLDPDSTTHTLTINANDNIVGFAASGGGGGASIPPNTTRRTALSREPSKSPVLRLPQAGFLLDGRPPETAPPTSRVTSLRPGGVLPSRRGKPVRPLISILLTTGLPKPPKPSG